MAEVEHLCAAKLAEFRKIATFKGKSTISYEHPVNINISAKKNPDARNFNFAAPVALVDDDLIVAGQETLA